MSQGSGTSYDLRFSLLGIPVRVHPMFWLGAVVLGLGGNDSLANMLLWVGAVFVSIVVHEMGHALTARAYGWEPWISLHAFGGLASYRPTYHSSLAQLLITFAGPLAGFAFAALILGVVAATGHRVQLGWFGTIFPFRYEPLDAPRADKLVFDLLFINIAWGLINLLPVLPLDGGRIASVLLEEFSPRDGYRQALWMSVIGGAIVAFVAFSRLKQPYLGMLFAYLAIMAYQELQARYGPGGGLGGYR